MLKSEKGNLIIIKLLYCVHAALESLNREPCDNVSGMTMSCYICAMTADVCHFWGLQ